MARGSVRSGTFGILVKVVTGHRPAGVVEFLTECGYRICKCESNEILAIPVEIG